MALSPIILFIYNRPEHTLQTLEALSKNVLADKSELFIFADGAKQNSTQEQIKQIEQTRLVAKEKSWCGKVTVIEAKQNKGLALSIINGVTDIVNKFGKVIVLEDDIVTGVHFLEYMNDALDKYENEKKVFHITGFRDPIKVKKCDYNSSFFYPVMDCWSWATWADRWQYFKKDTDFYISTFTDEMIYRFNHDGTEPDMWNQIVANKEGRINTWAIFWYASIFLQNGLCLSPCKSLSKNIGFDGSGVHCGSNPLEEIVDSIDYKITDFPDVIEVDKEQYGKNKKFNKKRHYVPFSRKVKDFIVRMLVKVFPRLYKVYKRVKAKR